jgi:hypothetical protein
VLGRFLGPVGDDGGEGGYGEEDEEGEGDHSGRRQGGTLGVFTACVGWLDGRWSYLSACASVLF